MVLSINGYEPKKKWYNKRLLDILGLKNEPYYKIYIVNRILMISNPNNHRYFSLGKELDQLIIDNISNVGYNRYYYNTWYSKSRLNYLVNRFKLEKKDNSISIGIHPNLNTLNKGIKIKTLVI